MKLSRIDIFFVVLIIIAALLAGSSFFLKDIKIFFVSQTAAVSDNQSNVLIASSDAQKNPVVPAAPLAQKLSNPPEIVKAVYVTGYSAGSKKYLDYLSGIFKTTEVNAVVVDIKDYSGLVSYNSGAPAAKQYNLYNNAIPDIDALVNFFHNQNIYVIGRIAVFEDPAFSKSRPDLAVYNKIDMTIPAGSAQPNSSQRVLWQDNHGLSWLDPASKDVWDYNISLAKDALHHGFDEINFDYVRFPSDGKTENMGFPVWDGKTAKSEVIKNFFQHVRSSLSGEKTSVDLFGLTTVSTDDMGIGQVIENAFENFDYVSPMVYPSHYASGFIGFSNPAEHPYEVIKYSIDSALSKEKNLLRQQQDLAIKSSEAVGSPAAESQLITPIPAAAPLAKLRPWLQDFNMGADYTADMVKAEIKATQDSLGSNFFGFMLWSPSNLYTKEAVLPR